MDVEAGDGGRGYAAALQVVERRGRQRGDGAGAERGYGRGRAVAADRC